MPQDSPATLSAASELDPAPWHATRPHLLVNALMEARRVAPHLEELAARWLPRLPRRPLASQNIRSICRDPHSSPMLLDDALTCPWLAPNTGSGLNAFLLDLDHADALELREEAVALGAPIPDLVIDPWSGRAHAVLWLSRPVLTTPEGRSRPQEAADYAGRLLAAAWRATRLPQTSLVKSPWGLVSNLIGHRLRRGPRPSIPARWEVYEASGTDLMWITLPGSGPSTIAEIVNALAPRYEFDAGFSKPKVQLRKKRGVPDDRGRNCELFDLTRWFAYDHPAASSHEILAEATRINNSGIFAAPLPAAEVLALARSISRFMSKRYRPRHGVGDRRGRDRADGVELDQRCRQQLAGERSAAARAEATDQRIAEAVSRLQAAAKPLTQSAIAAEAGVALRTVKSRWRRSAGTQKVQDAVLSGDAARPALGNQSVSFLASISQHDRQVRRAVRVLEAATVAARKPGATVSTLPVFSPHISREPAVTAARRSAEIAMADAARRHLARSARQRAAALTAEMRQHLRDPRAGWVWWNQHLADLDLFWDGMEAEAEPRERAFVQARREIQFATRWRQWRSAVLCSAAARTGNEVLRPDASERAAARNGGQGASQGTLLHGA